MAAEIETPDLVVLRAIGRGTNTRTRLRRVLGLDYDVIDGVIERHSVIAEGEDSLLRLQEPVETPAEIERGRYEEFVTRCQEQKVEPLPFGEWQRRFGGPSDAVETSSEPLADHVPTEELCDCGKEKGHRGRHRGVADLSEGADLDAAADEADLELLPEAKPSLPDIVTSPVESSYRAFNLRELDEISPIDLMRRFNTLSDNEIDQFFTALNSDKNHHGIYWGVIENRKDYQRFCRLAYSVLVELLTPWMTEAQQNAIWTLILYVNKGQKQ